MTCRVLWLK